MRRREGVQLELFALAAHRDDSILDWQRSCNLREELDEFEGRLIERLGHRPSSAAEAGRRLAAPLRRLGCASIGDLLTSPEMLVATLRATRRRRERMALWRAVTLLIAVWPERFTRDVGDTLVARLTREFGERAVRGDFLLDVELGGDIRTVREPVPFLFGDGDRLIGAAAEHARPSAAHRDPALVALHVRSTLSPGEITDLSWDSLAPLLASDAGGREVLHLRTGRGTGGARHYTVHATAIPPLHRYWRERAMPTGGPAFVRERGSRVAISQEYASELVRGHLAAAGFGGLDRRRLRDPFVRWLRLNGTGLAELRELLDVSRIGIVEGILRRQEELTAQMQAREALWLPTASTPVGEEAGLVGGRSGADRRSIDAGSFG